MDLRSGKNIETGPMDSDERKEHEGSWKNTSLDDIAEPNLNEPIVGI